MQLPQNTIVAAGPVIIENGKVLLNREKKSDGDSPYFMFPGGTLNDFGETLEQVAQREAKDEMGIDIEIIRPLRTLLVKRPGKEDAYAILAHYLAKRIGEINPGPDTIEWDWFDVNNLPTNCAPNVYEIIGEIN